MGKITMKDIAKEAGVSKSTVSRVINNTKPVSDEIRRKVEKVIKKNNYKPSSIARSLAKKETKVIGLIIPDLSNSFYAELIAGVYSKAHLHGYNVFLCDSFKDHNLEIESLNLLKEKQVDAIILTTFHTTSDQKEFIKNFNKPLVTVNRKFSGSELPIVPNVDIDNFSAAYDSVKYLIELGFKKIGSIIAGQDDQTCIDRLNGYKLAMKESNLEINSEHIVTSDFHFESSYKSMMKILKSKNHPEAMFCLSDEIATGAIRAIIDYGLKVPKDISVIGFDDVPLAKRFIPSITTIHQPIFEMGKKAMGIIYNWLDTGKVLNGDVELDYKLIIRDSTLKKKED